MGGLAGHMMHLYDDESLTFGGLKSFVHNLLSGTVNKSSVTEKTDGQNLFVSYNGKEFIAARNITQVKSGGVPLSTLKNMWPDNPSVQGAFTNGFNAFIKAAQSFGASGLNDLFSNGENWINMEILYPESANTIAYDKKAVQFHSIQKWDPDKKKMVPTDTALFDKFKKKVITGIRGGNEWSILGPIYMQLSNNSREIGQADSRLKKVMSQVSVGAGNTIGDYTRKRLGLILKEFGVTQEEDKKEIIERTIQGKNALKKQLELYPGLKGYTAAKLKRMALEPLEDFVGFVSFIVLRNLVSSLTAYPDAKAKTMDKEVKSVMKSVKGKLGRSHADYKWLEAELNKISKYTSFYAQNIEGVAIEHSGKLYKLTGFFAPINQILGAIKFGKIKLEHYDLNFRLLTEARKTKIAIFPGAFKPPHIGHFSIVKDALKRADLVYVIASSKERDGVGPDVTKHVWEKYYIPALGNKVKLIMAPISPVKSTFDMLEDLDADVILYAGKEDLARFKDAQKYAKQDSTLTVKSLPRSLIPVSGKQLRTAIRAGDKSVLGFIPREVKKKKELVDYLAKNI